MNSYLFTTVLALGAAGMLGACLAGDPEGALSSEPATGDPMRTGPAPGYYDAIDHKSPDALRIGLHALIDDHVWFPYSDASDVDTWDILERADADPDDSERVLDVYRNASYPRAGGGNPYYHREHSWPKSLGFPDNLKNNYPYTDCHHLFIADGIYNSDRGNKPFDQCDAGCAELATEARDDQGGTSGVYPGDSNWTTGYSTTGVWEVWRGRRGDIARAMFYMDVRYEGGVHEHTGKDEPDLVLTDDLDLIQSSTGNQPVGFMGRRATLLRWHHEDPVSEQEIHRNDVIEFYQRNRNPFVDHPEWADCLFADSCAASAAPPWINELHYDNEGADEGEGVEIAGPAGLDLEGWSLVGYNGASQTAYQSVTLSGVIPDQGGDAGALWFAFDGLQNGSPDAIALVDRYGAVVQFLGYEGSLVAEDGPAAGMHAVDIGVAEDASTSLGHALQLSGQGCAQDDFAWGPASLASPGTANAKQSFICD